MKTTHVHVPVAGFLGICFIVLKLLGKIDWSWVWVLAPFWVPLVLVLLIAGVLLVWRTP